jgi:signal transduction histidine kinase
MLLKRPTFGFLFTFFVLLGFVNPLFADNVKQKQYYHISPEALQHAVELNTQWEFYWSKLYNEIVADSITAPEYIKVPDSWTALGHPAQGYGLFVLNIITPNITGKPIALKIPTVTTSMSFYADGVKIAAAGLVGRDKSTSVSDYQPQVVVFTPKSDTIELAFEVGNYNYRVAGVDYPVMIGTTQAINKSFNTYLYFAAFVAGALLIMFFYFLGFFMARRTDYTALYFSLLSLVSALRIMSTDGILIRQLNLPISWAWLVNIELISIVLIPVFGALYLYSLLKETKFKWLLYTFNTISTAITIYVIVMNSYYDSLIVPPFRVFVFLQMLFILFVSVRSMIVLRGSLAWITGTAYIIVFIAGVNDILYSGNFIETFFVLPYAILFYVVLQAVLMSRYIAFAFHKVEQLSTELAESNKNQERVISERTAELHQQSTDLQRYNEVKDKILSIIAHDLRSPIASLSSVITLAEIGGKEDLDDIRSFFNSVKPHIDNLNLTIDNLFVWANNQIDGKRMNTTNLSLNSVIARVFPLYDLVAKQKQIKLVNSAKEPIVVRADNSHLELVLRNLISNAIKFTKDSGTVEILSRVIEGEVEVIIKDTGIGISEENIKKIFDTQTHYTTYGTNNEKGTGLGLRLCQEYVQFNGGRIWIESELGKGSSVHFTLPKPKA